MRQCFKLKRLLAEEFWPSICKCKTKWNKQNVISRGCLLVQHSLKLRMNIEEIVNKKYLFWSFYEQIFLKPGDGNNPIVA